MKNAWLTAILISFSIPNAFPFTQTAGQLPNSFFAYEFGDKTPAQQAELIREFGFDGTVFDGAKLVSERLKAVDEQRVQLFFLWLTADVSNGIVQYEPGLATSIGELKGRNTVIWLAIKGGGPGAEDRAIQAVRNVSDLAASANLRVALYPHYGFYLARFKDVLRVAEAADRSNVGVTFNLCHELRAGLEPDLEELLKRSQPRLYAVTINGANRGGRDWDTLIQPLGQGDFDVASLLRTLFQNGYRGPIGLQCYGLKEDPRKYLPQSMKAWREMTSR